MNLKDQGQELKIQKFCGEPENVWWRRKQGVKEFQLKYFWSC